MVQVLMVGDSDIDFWPCDLLPSVDHVKVVRKGYSGATMNDIVARLQADLAEIDASCMQVGTNKANTLVVVACAGENDIGGGISLDSSVGALQAFLDLVFDAEMQNSAIPAPARSVLFLGPKFEPWLEDDPFAKKQYAKMSRSFSRCCKKHRCADRICFVDCLTTFCGNTASIPGATLAGKARAEPRFFAADLLHLSRDGYRLLNKIVEQYLLTLTTERN